VASKQFISLQSWAFCGQVLVLKTSWRFPCKYQCGDGTVIECGSKDKRKAQLVLSKAHLKFLTDIQLQRLQGAVHLFAEAVIEKAAQDECELDYEDPLNAVDITVPFSPRGGTRTPNRVRFEDQDLSTKRPRLQ
jgi:hypothetical protein